MKLSFRTPRAKTKLVYRFQQQRSEPPSCASKDAAHLYEVGNSRNPGDKRALKCPKCGHVNHMDHGDRLLCGCGTFLELYGNGYAFWNKSQELQSGADYSRVDQTDLAASIIERLQVDPVVRKAAKDNPSVMAALEQVEVMIKMHENL